jgi:hypothetical protein
VAYTTLVPAWILTRSAYDWPCWKSIPGVRAGRFFQTLYNPDWSHEFERFLWEKYERLVAKGALVK